MWGRRAADLRGVAAEKGVPEMDQSEGEVLEEEETQKLAHPDVGPAAVHQQEALQVTELGEGVVAGHDGLHPLLAADAYANVCSWRGQKNGEAGRDYKRRQHSLPHSLTHSLLIMLTSFAPSPMDSVTAFLCLFTKLTTLAFCLGVTRQQMTDSHSQAMSTKSVYGTKTFSVFADQ